MCLLLFNYLYDSRSVNQSSETVQMTDKKANFHMVMQDCFSAQSPDKTTERKRNNNLIQPEILLEQSQDLNNSKANVALPSRCERIQQEAEKKNVFEPSNISDQEFLAKFSQEDNPDLERESSVTKSQWDTLTNFFSHIQ